MRLHEYWGIPKIRTVPEKKDPDPDALGSGFLTLAGGELQKFISLSTTLTLRVIEFIEET